MSDLLGIGSSALLAYQRALATTGHNIANASTPGYTRQRVELVSQVGSTFGGGFSGAGVQITQITRLSDEFATGRLLFDASAYGQTERFQILAGRVDQLLSDSQLGLTGALSQFYAALDGVAADPGSGVARQVLLSSAETLTTRFQTLQTEFDELSSEVDRRLQASATQINTLTQTIADLNDRIALATGGSGGQLPHDLVDQRDQALTSLASLIGITTTEQEDGAVNVFTVDGHALVLGTQTQSLTTVQDPYAAGRLDLAVNTGSGALRITNSAAGGEVGGLLAFRREVLDPAMGELGRLAVALSEAFNAQHAEGLDAYGDLGGDFFAVPQPGVFARGDNAGAATVGVSYGDVGELTGDSYLLRFDGAAWHLLESGSGSELALAGAGTVGNPFVAGGLRIVIGGGAAASGDSYLVEPARSAAGQIDVAITNPSRIAAASPVRTEAALANAGTGTIGAAQVLDAADANLRTPATIQFLSATTYSIDGGPALAYTAGANIDYQGWRVQISGAPAAGDTFQVLPTAANSADNGNARLLAGFRSATLLDGGTRSLSSGYSGLVAQVGTQAYRAGQNLAAQATLREHDQASRDAVAGVNLDEEAANLVRFQQAYQAAAQVIAVADTLFQSLLAAVRR